MVAEPLHHALSRDLVFVELVGSKCAAISHNESIETGGNYY
jgi:hypothetical protein